MVTILVGGPDWPTSVLCGILGLDLLPILLGTLPVFLLILPTVMGGAFLSIDESYAQVASVLSVDAFRSAAVCTPAHCGTHAAPRETNALRTLHAYAIPVVNAGNAAKRHAHMPGSVKLSFVFENDLCELTVLCQSALVLHGRSAVDNSKPGHTGTLR